MLVKIWDCLLFGNDVIIKELYCWGRKVKYGGDFIFVYFLKCLNKLN